MPIQRYLEPAILKDLRKKMVFLGGPRQCGKTTLSESVLESFPFRKGRNGLYLNWDDGDDRSRILKKTWGESDELIVLDELHKFSKWRNWLKGVYDKQKGNHRFFVTGSARLDVYRRGGDSLLGRYHYWRLHPFTLSESIVGMSHKEKFRRLMRVGGFPEPFLDGDEVESKRWRRERLDRVVRDDIRDLEQVQDIQTLSLFVDALRERVGGLVVLSNIAEDLQVSQKTLKRWLNILEQMYLVFVVPPFTKNLPRAVQKPPKVYFFDNADVKGDEGAVFENLVATHLLKRIHFLEDSQGDRWELRYIRDRERREVDFALVKNGSLHELYEAKYSQRTIHSPLQYYAEKLKPRKAIQVVAELKESYSKGKLQIQPPFADLATHLP